VKDKTRFPRELLDLFDHHVRGDVSRREFFRGAAKFAVGGLTTAAILESLSENYAWAQQPGGPVTRPSQAARLAASKRKPIYTLRDPAPMFSSVAVDLKNDEVVMADENNFQILSYSRLENTPPTARMSEPKRIIGGDNAMLEFNCSVYVDPQNGDVYTVNNDTLTWLTVFSREVKGNTPPTRKLQTPQSAYGLAVDEEKQELFLTDPFDQAILIFKKTAQEYDSPIRVLQGSSTQLADPHGLALDPKAGLMFVANWGTTNDREPLGSPNVRPSVGGGKPRTLWPVGIRYAKVGSGRFNPPSISVYPIDAHGDVAPVRVIMGPKAQMNWPTAMAISVEHGELFVVNDTGDSVTVYKTDASGDAAPIRVIKGPKSLIKNPVGITYDPKNDEIWVANFGNHSATVHKRSANGDEPPIRIIRSAPLNATTPMLGNPRMLKFGAKRGEVLNANCVAHPQLAAYPAKLATGSAKPIRALAGQNTQITRHIHDFGYDWVHDEYVIPQYYAFAIMFFPGDASGDVAPTRMIHGPKTLLKAVVKLNMDPVNGEIYVPQGDQILVFSRDQVGDVAPIRVLKGPETLLGAGSVEVDATNNVLYVSGSAPGGGPGGGGGDEGGDDRSQVLVFDRTASGNVKPLSVIHGRYTKGVELMTAQPSRGLVCVSYRTGQQWSEDNFVAVWHYKDNGDAVPLWTIGGPSGALKQTRGNCIDVKNKNVIVSDKYLNAILTFNFPEIF
jgi:DNA-binding beta-propeller fold protein YncE